MAPIAGRPCGLLLGGALLLAACASDNNSANNPDVLDKPEVTRSLMKAAAASAAQNDPAGAVTYYGNIFSRDPNNIAAAIGLMQNLRDVGDLDQAREVADKALATKPDDPAVLAEAGKVKLASGQLQDAIKLLQRAADLDAQDWKARSALGLAYDRLGNFAEADESYQAALKISPGNAVVLNNFGLSRAMAHDLAGAREMLQQAVATAGANIRVRQNLALVYVLSGNMALAEEIIRRDLPPDLARDTLAYYRELAAGAAK